MKLSLQTLRRLQAERIGYAMELETIGRSGEAAIVWAIVDSITLRIEARMAALPESRRSA